MFSLWKRKYSTKSYHISKAIEHNCTLTNCIVARTVVVVDMCKGSFLVCGELRVYMYTVHMNVCQHERDVHKYFMTTTFFFCSPNFGVGVCVGQPLLLYKSMHTSAGSISHQHKKKNPENVFIETRFSYNLPGNQLLYFHQRL